MKTTLHIDGMSCQHCVHAVREALEQVPGVTVEDVTLGTATVERDPAAVPGEALVAAVEEEGYTVREMA